MNFQYEFTEDQDAIVEPVLLDEMKAYMRIDLDYASDDDIIESFITASRQRLELYLNLGLVEHEVKLQWAGQPIKLPFSPTTEATVIVTKVSDDEVLEDDKYTYKGLNEKTLYIHASSLTRSFFYNINGDVSLWDGWINCEDFELYNVVYNTGYENVPKALKNAIMADVDYMYKNQGKDEMNVLSPMAIQLSHNYSKNLVIQ